MLFIQAFAAALALSSSAFATITIAGPSATEYWVQFSSNLITWQYAAGDPSPIDIIVTNSNSTYLNGPFSIARYVDLSNGTFTVTNVTLVVAPGYVVEFVNPANAAQVYASSGSFEVKPNGTTPATQTTARSAPTSTSPSGTGSGTATASTSKPSSSSSAALRSVHTDFPALPFLVSGGMVLVGAIVTIL